MKRIVTLSLVFLFIFGTQVDVFAYTESAEKFQFNTLLSRNKDYNKVIEFYTSENVEYSKVQKIITNLKKGILPLSDTNKEAPIRTKKQITKNSEKYIFNFSDGSIATREVNFSNCKSGSGYTTCDAYFSDQNSSTGAAGNVRFTRVQGRNNDSVSSIWGAVAWSKIPGLKISNVAQRVCRSKETATYAASAEVSFKAGAVSGNVVRFKVKNEKTSTYRRTFGDSNTTLAAC
ncbi:MAG: hypothetical protein ACRCUP_04085 [Mycoplasmatales bacterium]